MNDRGILVWVCLCLMAFAMPALAKPSAVRIDIPSAPLVDALLQLARQTDSELLFDSNLVRGRRSPAIRGVFTTEAALRQMLAGTNLRVRQAASGAIILEAAAPPALAAQDIAVPEILVVGRRTQNADIRRRETDVQPYRVTSRKDILGAHQDNLDQYFRSRVTANTEIVAPSQMTTGETNSEIDLRGLGPLATLILIDGRRMPAIPRIPFGFRQSDINAVPLHAIERVETLTGTAGGIYGFGALGGVVNVVLDRQFRGLALHQTVGLSERGDAFRASLEGSLGLSFNEDRTVITLFGGATRSDGLKVGERDYRVRDRELGAQNGLTQFLNSLPNGNSITVYSDFSRSKPLILKPEFGGTNLGSGYTYLPAGFAGNAGELAASLVQHAGQLDLGLSPEDARSDLNSTPETSTFLMNVRHRFDAGIEVYADAIILDNRGRFLNPGASGIASIPANFPGNPFAQAVVIAYEQPAGQSFDVSFRTSRYTAGVTANLPFDWRGTAEASFGSLRYDRYSSAQTSAVTPGSMPTDPSSPVNPFGDWTAFQNALSARINFSSGTSHVHNRFREQSVRLAGPVFKLPGGPTTLSLLAERRDEYVPVHVETGTTSSGGVSRATDTSVQSRQSRTLSFYAELRPRIFGDEAPIPFLERLELQLAVRHDRQSLDFSESPTNIAVLARQRIAFSGTAYTAGLKVSPTPWLTLRGSYATGEQPPELNTLIDGESVIPISIPDPKRPGTLVGDGRPIVQKNSGSPDLKTIRASTFAVGAILSPWGETGPRLALDYSHVRRTGDVQLLGQPDVLAHEDFWPERVTRAPLSDADRARGYTVGPVTVLDSRALNAGALDVQAIDAKFEWPTSGLGGRLRFYGDATYHIRNLLTGLFRADLDRAGYRNSPLQWRANGGVDWSNGRLTLGANLQYFGPYNISVAGQVLAADAQLQGNPTVHAQTYLDLNATRRIPIPGGGLLREVTFSLGITNILNRRAPRESALNFRSPGYSRYGDPRGRRYELTISSSF